MHTFILFLLGVTSVISLAFIIDRGIALRRSSIIPPTLTDSLEHCQTRSDLNTLLRFCQQHERTPLARLTTDAIEHLEWAKPDNVVRLGPLQVLNGVCGQPRQRGALVLLAEPQKGIQVAARLAMLQAVSQGWGDDGAAPQGNATIDDKCEADHRGDSKQKKNECVHAIKCGNPDDSRRAVDSIGNHPSDAS